MSIEDAARALLQAGPGFTLKSEAGKKRTAIALAIAGAESGWDPEAVNRNLDGSIDRGAWQFNSKWHPEVTPECAFDLQCAAREVHRVSLAGTNFSQWTTWRTGAYRKHLPLARRILASLEAEDQDWTGIDLPNLPDLPGPLPDLPNLPAIPGPGQLLEEKILDPIGRAINNLTETLPGLLLRFALLSLAVGLIYAGIKGLASKTMAESGKNLAQLGATA